MSAADSADPTRSKLIAAAGEVFAERGFYATTVREICARAGANVAAVNYYFRDKTALYAEVLRQSISAAGEEQILAPQPGGSPEDLLRGLIVFFLQKMRSKDRPAWHLRIMAHEMARPTPALSLVIDDVIRPRYARLRAIVGSIIGLPPDHETTRLCAHSIIGQLLHYVHAQPVIAHLWPDLKMTPGQTDRIARHIADFSLAGLHDLAAKNKPRRKGSSQ